MTDIQTETPTKSIHPQARRRELRLAWLAKNPGYMRKWKAANSGYQKPFKAHLCSRARHRGRKRGFEATITPADLDWPTHCPVLGMELDYPERTGMRGDHRAQPNWASLDRWDNTKGYVKGNVRVISMRANALKSDATVQEIENLLAYMRGER